MCYRGNRGYVVRRAWPGVICAEHDHVHRDWLGASLMPIAFDDVAEPLGRSAFN